MHHPEFSSQIAADRRARYFADAGRRRLARVARTAGRAPLVHPTDGDSD
jgi:hypothetical protein